MPEFAWKAARANAEIVEGRITAPTQARAMQQLRAQGLTLLTIAEAAALAPASSLMADTRPSGLGKLFQNDKITQVDILALSLIHI